MKVTARLIFLFYIILGIIISYFTFNSLNDSKNFFCDIILTMSAFVLYSVVYLMFAMLIDSTIGTYCENDIGDIIKKDIKTTYKETINIIKFYLNL